SLDISVAIRKLVSPGDNRHCERSEPRRTPGLDCFVALRAPRNDKCFPDVVNFRTRILESFTTEDTEEELSSLRGGEADEATQNRVSPSGLLRLRLAMTKGVPSVPPWCKLTTAARRHPSPRRGSGSTIPPRARSRCTRASAGRRAA